MDTRHSGANKIRVTCRTLMALRLVAEWKRIAAGVPQTDYGAKLREGIRLSILLRASPATTRGAPGTSRWERRDTWARSLRDLQPS